MEMEIDLTQLETDGARFVEVLGAADFAHDGPPERFEPLRAELSLTLRRERGGVRATGDLAGAVRAECDRCLAALEVDVTSHFDQRYVWGPVELPVDEAEVEVDDLDVERVELPVLDTRALAYEQLELAEPIRVVCSETCKGLCGTCGANLNTTECDCEASTVDPRWEALKVFKKQ